MEERQTIPWPKPTRTNSVMQNTSKNVRQYHGQTQHGQTMLYKTHRRTSDNTMANQQGQTVLYKTHRRTSDNTMAKTNKDKQCYIKHIEERQTIPWPKTNKDKQCYTKHIEERQTIP